jgi:hypothetical protein
MVDQGARIRRDWAKRECHSPVVPCRLNQNSEKKIANVRQKELELEKAEARDAWFNEARPP